MRSAVNHVLAMLLGLVAILAGSLTTADAQTMSNIATIQWDAGTSRIIRNSNQVDLVVEQSPSATPTLTTYRLDSSQAAQNVPVPTTLCQGSAGTAPVVLQGVFSGTPLSPASVVQTTRVRAGEPLILAINSTSDNQNPNAIDTLTVRLDTPSGDSETLTLSESGPNTAVFVGIIRTVASPPTPTRNDCVLSLLPGERLTLTSRRLCRNINAKHGGEMRWILCHRTTPSIWTAERSSHYRQLGEA